MNHSVTRDTLVTYCDTHLRASTFRDYCPNGLQIEGRSEIRSLATAVTASAAVLTEAVKQNIDLLLVHHGYFWKSEPAIITGPKMRKIKACLDAGLNLVAYHLPLDVHPELGNNVTLARKLGLQSITQHKLMDTEGLGWMGHLSQPHSLEQVITLVQHTLGRAPTVIASRSGKQTIERIGLCTGAAQDGLAWAAAQGADLYISGELSLRTYDDAQEYGMHYIAGGHHATERFGIQALGEHLAAHFNLSHQFIDDHNPI